MDTTESQDDNDNHNNVQSQSQTTTIAANNNTTTPSGYYDAEKCRAHIANQMRVSKIDRFAAQVHKALEVEADVNYRLCNILNMFLKRSALVAHDFTLKCKLGLQNHRKDRILNQSKTNKKNNKTRKKNKPDKQSTTINSKTRNRIIDSSNLEQYTISNDLLYGEGAQLIHELFGQSKLIGSQFNLCPPNINKKPIKMEIDDNHCNISHEPSELDLRLNDIDDTFEPALFVKRLEGCIRVSLQRSHTITSKLTTIRQIFEKLASEHRAKVDLVYAAEEERQSSTVIRRSAYNLSVAAIKAASTPIHVNSNVDKQL